MKNCYAFDKSLIIYKLLIIYRAKVVMKKIIPILGNSQKLDGGAMFGNVPKEMWQKWVEVDDKNRISLSCRAMLIKDNDKLILCEAGIGAFFEPKLKARFGVVEKNHILLESLAEHSIQPKDIDIIILSHLHFDHAGGLLTAWQEDHHPELVFPNAKYIVSKKSFERAKNPHPRDKASFIPILNELLEKSGKLKIIDDDNKTEILGNDYKFHFSDGHTPGMMLTEVNCGEKSVIFAADLIPASSWVHVPITMGYDRFPEKLIDEKKELLEYVEKNNIELFFTHDDKIAMAKITKNNKGKYICVID